MSAVEQVRPYAPYAGALVGLALVAFGLGMMSFDTSGAVSTAESILSGTSVVFVAGAIALVAGVWQAKDADESNTVGPLVAFAGVIAMVYAVMNDPGGFVAALTEWWWLLPAAGVGYVALVFVSERGDASTASTAVEKTQKRVLNNANEAGQTGFGLVLGILSGATALAMAGLASLEVAGDILVGFATEIAYLATVGLGYLGVGGSIPGDQYIPALSPGQWLAVTLIIGGIAVAIKE